MLRLWILFTLMDVVLTVAALIVCSTTEDHEVAAFPKIVWMLIILFVPILGAMLWFVYGRKVRLATSGSWSSGRGFPETERPRQLAPDDDPAFLRRLADEQRRSNDADAEMLRKWEEDLRRRERELRERSSE